MLLLFNLLLVLLHANGLTGGFQFGFFLNVIFKCIREIENREKDSSLYCNI